MHVAACFLKFRKATKEEFPINKYEICGNSAREKIWNVKSDFRWVYFLSPSWIQWSCHTERGKGESSVEGKREKETTFELLGPRTNGIIGWTREARQLDKKGKGKIRQRFSTPDIREEISSAQLLVKKWTYKVVCRIIIAQLWWIFFLPPPPSLTHYPFSLLSQLPPPAFSLFTPPRISSPFLLR